MKAEYQQFPWGIICLLFGLWLCYEIDRGRKREGRGGIPILGSLFDSITLTVREEVVDVSLKHKVAQNTETAAQRKKQGPQEKKLFSRSKSSLQKKKSKRSRRSKRDKGSKRSCSHDLANKTKQTEILSGSSTSVSSLDSGKEVDKKKDIKKKTVAHLPTKKSSREKSLDGIDMVEDD